MDIFNISHYRILQKLGSGGSAEVFMAEDVRLHRKVALKLLHRHLTEDAEKVERFRQEAQWASLLNHPNILTIYEIGEEDGTHYIATEHVAGETLRKRLAHPIPVREALEIAMSIGRALVAAHEAWIVHRDVKPENVMLRPDGYVKVLDFGMAKLTQVFASQEVRVKTAPRMIIGTIQYMAPEQLRGLGVDPRTDLFSLGIVLQEMITGKPPFRGSSWVEFMSSILDEPPLPLEREGEVLPPELTRILDRALQKDMNLRYQTAQEFIADMQELKEELDYEDRRLRRLT